MTPICSCCLENATLNRCSDGIWRSLCSECWGRILGLLPRPAWWLTRNAAMVRTLAPPIAGASDTERGGRIDAERVTAEWRTRNPRNIDGGKLPIDESPLFGGRKQEELF